MKLTTIILATLLLCLGAHAQTLPSSVFFVGASGEPNGGVAGAAIDIGGAKLIASSTYLGAVAHLSTDTISPVKLKTKIQLHAAQLLTTFRGADVYWTAEAGPAFAGQLQAPQPTSSSTTLGTPAANVALAVGYSIGSGPLVSIPIGHGCSVAFHAEAVKGSLEDLGWRGGVMFVIGSK